MAATKKTSFLQRSGKSWKCTVLLDIHSVTCQDVRLPQTGDIFLNVCIMDQCRKTSSLPPCFPLRFNQRLVFEKLIQSLSAENKTLAIMTQNSRDFLKPGPNLGIAEDSIQRDVSLMEISSKLHGAFPAVVFSVTSFIEESDWMGASPVRESPGDRKTKSIQHKETRTTSPAKDKGENASRRSPCPKPRRHKAKRRLQKRTVGLEPGYQQPTVSSTSRALSPYTYRKMCQLSLDSEQRLRHLELGPHHFKKETESIPPFLVPTCSSVVDTSSFLPEYYVESCQTGVLDDHYGFQLGSYSPRASITRSDDAWSSPGPSCSRRDELNQSPPRAFSASAAAKKRGTVTSKHSSRGRVQTRDPSPSYWEQIHSRVQRILQTHRVPLDLD
ncbi:spermatogenesis-associated protein 6 isoform X2 [Stigmatopora nigra]